MGLVGSLEDLSLLDILQIVNVSRRTGVLRLHRGEFGSAFIFFHEGAVREILGDFNEGAFLDYFLEQGLVDQSEADEAIEQAGSDRGRAVFHLLENGALNERLVEQARRQELARRLKSLVGQKQGEFAFYLADAPAEQEGEFPKPHMPLSLPVSPQVLLTEEPMTAEVKPTAPPPPLEEEAPAPPSQEPRPQSPDIEEPAPPRRNPSGRPLRRRPFRRP